MANEIEVWRTAAQGLSPREIAVVVNACERDHDPRAELSWLLGVLVEALSSPFLRCLVGELDARGSLCRAGDSVMPALVSTVIGEAAEEAL